MGILNIFSVSDINENIKEYLAESRAILLDAREPPEEYAEGHIKNSKNLPLTQFMKAESIFTDKSIPVYVYCRSGARSGRMAKGLTKLGFEKVVNIGGIIDYKGKLEK